MAEKQKLELTWIGKNEELKLEPRILIEDPDKSYGDKNTENMLIHGDNLLALKALEQDYTGRIKCIYIDPPYNTGNAFEHYDDGLEHSIWMTLMKSRLEMLKNLLSEDGLLAIQIDDNEFARLYLLLIELFGQKNLKVIVVKMSEATGVKMSQVIKTGSIPKLKEYIILAGKNGVKGLDIEKIPKEKWDDEYKLYIKNLTKEERNIISSIIDNDARTDEDVKTLDEICKKFELENVSNILKEKKISKQEEKEEWLYRNAWRIIRTCSTTGKAKELADEKRLQMDGTAFSISTPQNKIYIVLREYNSESSQPRIKILFADDYLTVHPGDFWHDIKTTGLGNEGNIDFTNGKKPEALIKRIISMSTKENDIVLDSFLGSGTTAAVAHKLNRKWIGIELGDHCFTHSLFRLKQVVDGEQGGISKSVEWKGGGGFKFYELAPSLLKKDKYDNWVIDENYNADLLASAVAKHEGFNYSPDSDIFWKQGKSTETDYIFTTTTFINTEYLDRIASEMKEDESLLICCKNFQQQCDDKYSNITIKKIPQMLLGKCEFGKEDYSLNIINFPHDESDDICDDEIEEEILEKELDEKTIQTTLF